MKNSIRYFVSTIVTISLLGLALKNKMTEFWYKREAWHWGFTHTPMQALLKSTVHGCCWISNPRCFGDHFQTSRRHSGLSPVTFVWLSVLNQALISTLCSIWIKNCYWLSHVPFGRNWVSLRCYWFLFN